MKKLLKDNVSEPDAFHAAIENLYEVFSKYQLPAHIEGCLHCGHDDKILRSKPLRELTNNDLSEFSYAVLSLWGTLDDLKHFLPRLFELVTNTNTLMDIEVVFGKLREGNWRAWQRDEQAAIEEFFTASWQNAMVSERDGWVASSLLCGIGQAADDLTPYLFAWENSDKAAAIRMLNSYIELNLQSLIKKRTLNDSFWKERHEQMNQVIEWLTNPKTAEVMEKAFFKTKNADLAQELSTAINQLQSLRAIWKAMK